MAHSGCTSSGGAGDTGNDTATDIHSCARFFGRPAEQDGLTDLEVISPLYLRYISPYLRISPHISSARRASEYAVGHPFPLCPPRTLFQL